MWVRCQKTLVHLEMILVVIKDFGGHKMILGDVMKGLSVH